MSESANADQITYWNDVAGAKWVANQERLDRVFTPLTEALIEAATLKPGEHVLDVGCGCGQTSLLAASHVGPPGRVLGVDLSRPMLDHAATRAGGAHAPVTWLQADAMTHAFQPESDVMISRFGVMFFADPHAAFLNLRRGLKPGARFAFICWRPRATVEWMHWPMILAATVLPMPSETTGQPGPFGFADADATRAMLSRSGFAAIMADPIDAALTIGLGDDPVGDAMAVLLDTGSFATMLREAEPDDRAKARDIVQRAVEDRVKDGAVRLGGACWLYRGMAA